MTEEKITTNQVMEYIKENKPDGIASKADVRNAIKALRGTMEKMGGIDVDAIIEKLNKPKPLKKPKALIPLGGDPARRPLRKAKKPYEDKIMKIAKENEAKGLKRGGKVKKQVKKKTGRLALRGYGISR